MYFSPLAVEIISCSPDTKVLLIFMVSCVSKLVIWGLTTVPEQLISIDSPVFISPLLESVTTRDGFRSPRIVPVVFGIIKGNRSLGVVETTKEAMRSFVVTWGQDRFLELEICIKPHYCPDKKLNTVQKNLA